MFETKYEKSKLLTKTQNLNIQKLVTFLRKNQDDIDTWDVLFELIRNCEERDPKFIHRINIDYIRPAVLKIAINQKKFSQARLKAYQLFRKSLFYSSRVDFDSFMQYMEIDVPIEKQFWLPRRKILLPICKDMQDLADDKLDILGISLIPRGGKTGLTGFYMAWLAGRNPEKAKLYISYSGGVAKMFYERILKILNDPLYKYKEIFPQASKYIDQSAIDSTIDLGQANPHKTIQCRGIDGSITGALEANELLICDDLVSGIEEALKIDRLDLLWEKLTSVVWQRMLNCTKQLYIGTRWSIHDPMGRLATIYEDNPRVKFIKIPALNEKNESNFMYDFGLHFDTNHFLELKKSMDEISFSAIFMQEPIEREGLLFQKDDLRLTGTKKEFGDEYRRFAVVDVAWGGGDYLAMPCAWIVKGNDGKDEFHIKKVVFSKQTREITQPLVATSIKNLRLHDIQFEANNGGDEYGRTVETLLNRLGWHCRVTAQKAPSTQAKLSRIVQFSPDIKERCVFLREEEWDDEYRAFMQNLMSFNQNGKNRNEDAPDSLAMLFMYSEKNVINYARPLPKAFKFI